MATFSGQFWPDFDHISPMARKSKSKILKSTRRSPVETIIAPNWRELFYHRPTGRFFFARRAKTWPVSALGAFSSTKCWSLYHFGNFQFPLYYFFRFFEKSWRRSHFLDFQENDDHCVSFLAPKSPFNTQSLICPIFDGAPTSLVRVFLR